MREHNYHCVAIIPIKASSKRVVGKNFRPLGGKPLFEHMLETALQSRMDAVFVNTDSPVVKARARAVGAEVIDRPEYLTRDTANGNDLLVYEAGLVRADIYVQVFATAPFLQSQTIRRSVDILETQAAHDSVLTVTRMYSWFWFQGQPVNYDPLVLPRSQDAQPIIRETTGLYAIRRQALMQHRCRIGAHPYLLEVDEQEGLDIDTEFDFQVAELIMQKRLAPAHGH